MRVWLAGLGNHTHPQTRHSIGQLLLHNLHAMRNGERAKWTSHKTFKLSSSTTDDTAFVLPLLPMNLNGRSLKDARVELERLVVLHDDLDLNPGTVKAQFAGSLRGHNGLRSIEAAFKSRSFARIRIGIGRGGSSSVVDHVLGPLDRDQLHACLWVADSQSMGDTLRLVAETLDRTVLPRLLDDQSRQ